MTWNVLKWVAIAAMFIDHTAAVMGGLVPFSWYDPMRDVGRMAFPIFAYGIAQGCVYTHSARRYMGRLLLFAVLSEVPYQLALGQPLPPRFATTNVFFTLFAGAACCHSRCNACNVSKAYGSSNGSGNGLKRRKHAFFL